MIRPAAWARLLRLRDTGFALVTGALGIWAIWLGGWVLLGLGAGLLLLAAGLGLIAWRRLRFASAADGHAAGIVDLDEAQIGWFGPEGGGFVSLTELAELRLIDRGAQRYWRLKQIDGQALLIPVAATGAEALFDAFAALPGMDSGALVAALDAAAAPAGDSLGPVIWRRQTRLDTATA